MLCYSILFNLLLKAIMYFWSHYMLKCRIHKNCFASLLTFSLFCFPSTYLQTNDMRRASLVALRRGSLRRGSVRRTSLVPASTSLDLPWDILDRLLIPILCCHAAAIILSSALNLLHISDVSTLTLFAWFALSTGGAILFYHHLKVCCFYISLALLGSFEIPIRKKKNKFIISIFST